MGNEEVPVRVARQHFDDSTPTNFGYVVEQGLQRFSLGEYGQAEYYWVQADRMYRRLPEHQVTEVVQEYAKALTYHRLLTFVMIGRPRRDICEIYRRLQCTFNLGNEDELRMVRRIRWVYWFGKPAIKHFGLVAQAPRG